MTGELDSGKLQRRILIYSVLGMLVIGTAIAVAGIWPLYQDLKKETARELYFNVRTKASAIETVIAAQKEIARQIASRSAIREKMEAFNRGEIGLPELTAYTEPRLRDSLAQTDQIAGLVRLDAAGRPIARIGRSLPEAWLDAVGRDKKQSVFGPWSVGAEPVLLIRTPIGLNPERPEGYDLVLFKTALIKRMVEDKFGLGKSGKIFLGYGQGPGTQWIFGPGSVSDGKSGPGPDLASAVNGALKQALRQNSEVIFASPAVPPTLLAFAPIPGMPWGLIITMDEHEMFRRLQNEMVPLALTLLVLLFAGAGCLFLLLRPLTGKVILHTDELQQRIAEQTQSLQEELRSRQEAEEALLRNEEKFRTVADWTYDWELWNDPQGQPIYISPSVERITGYPVEDFLADPQLMGRIIHPEDRPLWDEHFTIFKERRAGGEERTVLELRIVRRDGEVRWLHHMCRPVFGLDGRFLGRRSSNRDITLRIKAEMELKRTASELHTIIESTADGILVVDTQRRVLRTNARFQEMWGIPDDLISSGDDQALIDFIQDQLQDPEEFKKKVQDLYRSDRVDWDTIALNNGRIFERYSCPLLEEGSLTGRLWSFREITARKKAEEEKNRLEEHLRQSQKMESIGTLAGGIAHDFNNILGGIIGYTELALMDKATPEKTAPHLQQVLKAGQRAKDLVRQILNFSRRGETEYKPLALDSIIKEALKLLRSSVPTTIDFQTNLPSQPLIINGDPTQIHQVLVNLCTNAAYAMRVGGGVLKIVLSLEEIGQPPVGQLGGLRPGHYARLTVSDTGEGIAPDIIQRIFEPFFTNKKPGEGTGMGLAVVYGIVKHHGGGLAVHSELNSGSRFDIYLPLIVNDWMEQDPDPQRLLPRGSERILFVDDEEPLVQVGRALLERLGYRVTATTSSPEALRLFREQSQEFDLVITDMTMPRLTGLELSREMLAMRPDLPIVLCTGFSEGLTAERAKNIGIRDFIMKPIVFADLSRTIRKVFDNTDAG